MAPPGTGPLFIAASAAATRPIPAVRADRTQSRKLQLAERSLTVPVRARAQIASGASDDSRSAGSQQKALSGELGALRWAVVQHSDDACADHILIKMAVKANTSFECFMSVANLAVEVGCSARTIQRKLQHLISRGYLVDVSASFPWRRTKTFRLVPEALE